MKRILSLLLCAAMLLSLLCGCATGKPEEANTVVFSDSVGRQVTVPERITKIAPSGPTAQMILMTVAPQYLVGLSGEPDKAQLPYFPETMRELPTFGQFYGSKANLNMEALIAAAPQIIIDLGDKKGSIAEDMDMIQRQTGIPAVFIEADVDDLPNAYRMLGALLQIDTEPWASYIENTLEAAGTISATIPEAERKTVLFCTGAAGLACNADGSTQADVIPTVGAINSLKTDKVTNKGGGTEIDLERAYAIDPDVILFAAGGPYADVEANEWAELTAVKTDAYYEIPKLPYDWMSSPPSVNRILGIWWLGNLLYPAYYDYDMVEKAQEFYKLFWHYDLTREEAEGFLSRSTMK